MIEMGTKLKYILESNVFVVKKYKEAKNSKQIWNFAVRLLRRTTKFHVCRVFCVGARQSFKKKWILDFFIFVHHKYIFQTIARNKIS
jgi:hypothetical protein